MIDVEIWVCYGCGDYYAARSDHGKDLTKMLNKKLNRNEATHSRARCPHCGTDRVKKHARV